LQTDDVATIARGCKGMSFVKIHSLNEFLEKQPAALHVNAGE